METLLSLPGGRAGTKAVDKLGGEIFATSLLEFAEKPQEGEGRYLSDPELHCSFS